jgi:polar amino acid transport system substrate-binding protein
MPDRSITRRLALAAAIAPLALATACAQEESPSSSGSASAAPSEQCTKDQLALKQDGVLTVGTDKPAYEPWFVDNDPSNGKGYESAVAYAVAEELGFAEDEVRWTRVKFNNSYKPGPKDFDFDINQISITPDRAKVVDFSEGYYSAAQAVIALEGSKVADAGSVADLASYKLGAQTGTTSLTAIRDVIEPDADPLVFQDTSAAKQALENGQVDAILADLPTAFYITAVEIEGSTIVGQFQPETGQQEEFGLLMEKGSELLPCVNRAITALKDDGTLDEIQQEWLSDVVDVPVLK